MEWGKWEWARLVRDSKSLYDRVRYRSDEISFDDFRNAADLVNALYERGRELSEWLQEILPIGPEVVDQLTYGQAISYFVNYRPADIRAIKGAMLLEEDSKGQLLTQVFLDKNSNLVCDPNRKPYGRRIVIRSLDAELQETFGDKNLVIVE